jgi:hypothetical protein
MNQLKERMIETFYRNFTVWVEVGIVLADEKLHEEEALRKAIRGFVDDLLSIEIVEKGIAKQPLASMFMKHFGQLKDDHWINCFGSELDSGYERRLRYMLVLDNFGGEFHRETRSYHDFETDTKKTYKADIWYFGEQAERQIRDAGIWTVKDLSKKVGNKFVGTNAATRTIHKEYGISVESPTDCPVPDFIEPVEDEFDDFELNYNLVETISDDSARAVMGKVDMTRSLKPLTLKGKDSIKQAISRSVEMGGSISVDALNYLRIAEGDVTQQDKLKWFEKMLEKHSKLTKLTQKDEYEVY